jgi:hypothetical protein
VVWADAVIEHGVDTSAWVQARAGETRFAFHVSMRTKQRQAMVFEGDRATLTVAAPFNAGKYGQAELIVTRDDMATEIIAFPEVRQYALQVEAVAAHLLDGADFPYGLEVARGTQTVIDAVFDQLGR